MENLKTTIKYEDFAKIDVRAGTIISAEEIPNSDKLLKLTVDFGPLGQKQILSGTKKWYSPEELTGIQVCFVVNLQPRQMMGLTSEGMILAIDTNDKVDTAQDSKPALLIPKDPVDNGQNVH